VDTARQIVQKYRELVGRVRPDHVNAWPIVSGYNVMYASYQNWLIVVLKHTGNPLMVSSNGIGELSTVLVGMERVGWDEVGVARARLERHFALRPQDAVVFVENGTGALGAQLPELFRRHEVVMGLVATKIFLSHSGTDKPLVREYKRTLEALGFDPWLDEDAMPAGAELNRAILQGMKDSCAAVFFVTPAYKDAKYIADEVDYAINEKRARGRDFALITLVFDQGRASEVPELLRKYVWKEPVNDLEALREILRALPLCVGTVRLRE